jgi:drug/metabolite transporter (DMT)-like permease
MDRLSSGFVSVFLLLEPIISALLAWLIFVEHLSPLTWIGFAVVLGGIYLAKSSEAALHTDRDQSLSLPVGEKQPEISHTR